MFGAKYDMIIRTRSIFGQTDSGWPSPVQMHGELPVLLEVVHMENICVEGRALIALEIIGLAVTVISIIVTVISIVQTHRHEKSNRDSDQE